MAKFKPGASGNPNGRPAGKTLSDRLRKAVTTEFDGIVKGIIDAAKGGDIQAASLLLSRTCPTLRPTQEAAPVPIVGDTLPEQAAAILDAVSRGNLSTMDGKALIDALASVGKIIETTELAERLERIEAQLKARP